MKIIKLVILIFSLGVSIVRPQSKFETIFEYEINKLPFDIRIGNCGIYGISSFDIADDKIYFMAFDSKQIYLFDNNEFIPLESAGIEPDFYIEDETPFKAALHPESGDNTKYRRIYDGDDVKIFSDRDGLITGKDGESITVNVKNRSELYIDFEGLRSGEDISVSFNNDLAFSDLIGMDGYGNTYILIERYITDIPLKVSREILVVNDRNEIINRFGIPVYMYLTLFKEFVLDKEGNLYHLLSDDTSVYIIKLSEAFEEPYYGFDYPDKFGKFIHYNRYTTSDEPSSGGSLGNELTTAYRSTALRLGESYVLHRYYCNDNNIAVNNVVAPDGDLVRTPSWLITGWNAKVPYKWGGFNTLATFDLGLVNGKYAGDINTSGVSSYAVGVDCSGFVSRCWQLTYHSSTSMMPGITTIYPSWDDLKPGDAIHKVGHVRLFLNRNMNGGFRIVEASARDWGVSYWSYSASALTSYLPRYYNNMIGSFNDKYALIKRAEFIENGNIRIEWDSDTSDVKGYRLFHSTDGIAWTIFKDENELHEQFLETPLNAGSNYFRIVPISRSSAQEGIRSNIVAAGKYSEPNKVLIVDGFNRDYGSASWQGMGHPFALNYGKALSGISLSHCTVKNSEIENGNTILQNYDIVIWILGDESIEEETFSSIEQEKVKLYLEQGGNLFLSGSEIGWDLYENGSVSDRLFYNDYLKAEFMGDDSHSNSVNGTGSIFEGCEFQIGQTYEEDWPDILNSHGGSMVCLEYSNNQGAGIVYDGSFGNSPVKGKLVYLGFPLESTANDSAFNYIISKSADFFGGVIASSDNSVDIPGEFILYDNYPNPFNPTTIFSFYLPRKSNVAIDIFDMLGQRAVSLFNGDLIEGRHEFEFNSAGFSSGIYLATFSINDKFYVQKISLIK